MPSASFKILFFFNTFFFILINQTVILANFLMLIRRTSSAHYTRKLSVEIVPVSSAEVLSLYLARTLLLPKSGLSWEVLFSTVFETRCPNIWVTRVARLFSVMCWASSFFLFFLYPPIFTPFSPEHDVLGRSVLCLFRFWRIFYLMGIIKCSLLIKI